MSHHPPDTKADWQMVAEGNMFFHEQLHVENDRLKKKNAILLRLFLKLMTILDDR